MLQACLNGGLSKAVHSNVPVSAEELAHDAIAVRMAGADELHIHPRDEHGTESLEASDVGRALVAIRASVPEMPIGVGTGTWIRPGGRERHRLIEDWIVLPDYCSVNLNEDDALEVIDLLTRKGIGVEAGLWTARDAERFVSEVEIRKCLRVLIEMTADDPRAALQEADRTMEILARAKSALPVLLHGEGGSVWACVAEAARLGLSTRVGFEDGSSLPDGSVAENNASLVRAAGRYFKHLDSVGPEKVTTRAAPGWITLRKPINPFRSSPSSSRANPARAEKGQSSGGQVGDKDSEAATRGLLDRAPPSRPVRADAP
jgi:uncharacterized protein (DUF849 family)